MSRIGVFVCHCGDNIGRTVDCPAVAGAASQLPGVVHSMDFKYMCSDPGQQLMREGHCRTQISPAWWWRPAAPGCTRPPSGAPRPTRA
jgi:heterodisulfide reductase subunit A-like polyferredoxin